MLSRSGSEDAAEPLDAGICDRLFERLRDARRVLLAVSGGPDSIALLHLAASWSLRTGGPPLAVATVDHGLRPQARAEAEHVGAAAADLGLDHAILDWVGPKPATRLQERARAARYALLSAHARDVTATHLVTAHTLDDQAETILMRMARGSGISGLAGMRPRTMLGTIVHARPFLGIRKARLVATCRAEGWRFVEDGSNRDPRFARTRWRAVVAWLEEEGLGPERLGVLSGRVARAEAALEAAAQAAQAAACLEEVAGRVVYDGGRLLALPAEIFLRVLARAIAALGNTGEARRPLRLERLERLCADLQAALATGQPIRRTFAGALVWTRSDGTLTLMREAPRRRGGSAAAGG